MTDESPPSERERRRSHPDESDQDVTASSAMHARSWVIASTYNEPADYDIPRLPNWRVTRCPCRGLVFEGDENGDTYISAENPVTVRR